ncbi:hypothetical protein ACKAV7_011920 [Fusarium commune]
MTTTMTASNLQSETCSLIYPYVLLSTYRLLVCQICGFASVTDEVATHLKTRHRAIQPEHRQGLVEKINQIPNIIRNQDELRDLQYPANTIEPIPYLAPPEPDGLKCHACGHIVRHVQKIQKHCTDEHQWTNPGGRGRPPPDYHMSAYESPWEEGVAYQRFFPSRAGSRWFQVNSPTRLQRDVHKKGSSDFGEAMDEVPARPEYQLLQDEAILFNALQSKDFDDEQGEEEAYSDDEDEDTDSMFGYDEGDCDNSEVASNPAEAGENHHADRASKMWDESDTV